MFNDLRDEQSIIVYNTMSDEGDTCIYRGKVGNMDDKLYALVSLSAYAFHLLSDAEEYDVLAII